MREARRKVSLILDKPRVHDGEPVKARLAEHGDRIEVIDLPSDSPEPDPDECPGAAVAQAGSLVPGGVG